MKIGVVLPVFTGDAGHVVGAAREAEALGYEGVFVFDHLFPPGGPGDRPSLEALATLGAVAAVTEGVTVGTLVARVSLRTVGMTAKAAAWLDAASGGRLILGLGTGDSTDRPEHEAYGIPMLGRRERREQLEETIRALRALFRGDGYEGGRFVPPLAGPLAPPALRADGPPVWVAGQADDLVRMAARHADAWNGWGLDAPSVARKASLLEGEASAHGRAVEATWAGLVLAGTDEAETAALLERRRERGLDDEIWVGTTDDLVSFLRELEAAGASWAVLVTAGPRDRRDLVARRVLPHFS